MACVKGDGYGHGIVQVGRAALEGGADRLSVAHVEEGVALRQAGISAPIQVLIEPLAEQAALFFEHRLIASISTVEVVKELGERLPGRIKVHVEVDTGMGRVGLKPADVPAFCSLLEKTAVFELEGLFSHLPSCHYRQPDDEEFTRGQIATFLEMVRTVEAGGRSIPLKHLASSGGVTFFPESYLDMVRPGYLVYGLLLDNPRPPLTPALSWKSRVLNVLPALKGQGLGYDRNFRPEQDTRVAIVGTGYADGYPRALSNNSHVLIRGQRAKVVGLVAMDMIMVEVGHFLDVRRGDEVVIIGRQGDQVITCRELSKTLGTTVAQVTCGISGRVKRVYLNQRQAKEDISCLEHS
jgi:alanine racemase